MFRIKICGITNTGDAELAISAGADALGLNLYSHSPRALAAGTAAVIAGAVRALAPATQLVGVFVNESRESLTRIAAEARLTAWQLHGDEPAELLHELRLGDPQRSVIRALRCRSADLAPVAAYLRDCERLGSLPDAVLLDAFAPQAYGGTGQVLDWDAVREQRDRLPGVQIILAGGLTPENVAQAIRTARPDGVDVASGVESAPGRKDPVKVRNFVAAAQEAFSTLQ